MPLSGLPSELLVLIADHSSLRDGLTFAATNRHYHAALNDHIYRHFIQRDLDGNLPLRWACTNGSPYAVATARRALRLGAKVNGHDYDRVASHWHADTHLPLQQAVKWGHLEIIEVLLANGADPWTRNASTCPVALAAQMGNLEAVRLLVTAPSRMKENADADPVANAKHIANSHAMDGRSGLHEAALEGHDAVIRLLLDHGANVDIRDSNGNTPLHFALLRGWPGVVRVLLDAGADPLARDNSRESCLDRAMLEVRMQLTSRHDNGAERADRLIANLEQVLRKARSTWIARSAESGDGHTETDFWLGKSEHETHDFLVNARNSTPLVRLLIEAGGIPVDARSRGDGATPLWWYAGPNHHSTAGEPDPAVLEIVALLLDAGADINGHDTGALGQTPLMRAAEAWREDVVALLLSRGARVDITDREGSGVLRWGSHSTGVLQRLLDHGRQDEGDEAALSHEMSEQLELRDNQGRTPLILALWGGEHPDAAALLIRSGADVLVRDENGNDAIKIAASYDATAHLVPLLVQRGAPVNPQDVLPPLLAAVQAESVAGVKALLKHNAHPDGELTMEVKPQPESESSSWAFRLPLVCAIQSGNLAITRALLEGGASVKLALSGKADLLDLCREKGERDMVDLLCEHGATE